MIGRKLYYYNMYSGMSGAKVHIHTIIDEDDECYLIQNGYGGTLKIKKDTVLEHIDDKKSYEYAKYYYLERDDEKGLVLHYKSIEEERKCWNSNKAKEIAEYNNKIDKEIESLKEVYMGNKKIEVIEYN